MMRVSWGAVATVILLVFNPGPAGVAGAGDLPLWRIAGPDNTVYLLGSIHLLREPDYPLADAIYDAYEDAEQLVMELDLDDLDPATLPALVAQLGTLPPGSDLAQVLGADHFALAEELAAEAEVDLRQYRVAKPWLVAITIEQLILQRIGFDPALGVEAHFLQLAASDGKTIAGLETVEQQLRILDGLSLPAQRSLLVDTLEIAPDIGDTMDELVTAWQQGDVDYLEANLLADMREYPEVYRAVVVERNRQWASDIATRLDGDRDYLVIVGTLHLVGADGVPELLAEKGFSVQQLSQ